MNLKSLSPELLKACFIAAAAKVDQNRQYINELNVFPVPDGDTGTNVSMTLNAALREVEEAACTMQSVSHAISQGTLKGARGNSGVIFSQLIRGFAKQIGDLKEASPMDLALGFRRGTDTAYKAVMKPKEGTILTVARGMADKIEELAPIYEDITELFEAVCAYGDEVLMSTPEMLPVLKEAGVVDSGGMALMTAVHGALSCLKGELTDTDIPVMSAPQVKEETGHVHISTDDIKFGYCTECIINLTKKFSAADKEELCSYLLGIGDSLVCVEDDDIVKLHVHTDHPGLAFEKALTYGSLSRLKVDNLREEHEELIYREEKAKEQAPLKELACVAVCAGEGLTDIFKELGADVVISGGQTMNPSIDDILTAAEKAHAKKVLVLPNNKNIILASKQAGECTDGRFEIITVPVKTVMEGVAAMVSFDREMTAEENAAQMERAAAAVKTGEVTYAVRKTTINGVDIEEGDIMGICGDSISAGRDLNTAAKEMTAAMVDEDSSLISVYYGDSVKEEVAEELAGELTKAFPLMDVELINGGQPVYYYFVSVE